MPSASDVMKATDPTGQPTRVLCDVTGTLITSAGDILKPSYGAAVLALVPAATPTDLFTITGSTTKTVKIWKMRIIATQTTPAEINVLLIKRSTANSGGTFTTPVTTPADSNNAAGTAVVRAYTANPTVLGTSIGTFRTTKLYVSSVASATPSFELIWLFGDLNTQPLVLRGTGQVLAINLNSVTITGGNFNISIEWTEE